jgi:hypothetical protein
MYLEDLTVFCCVLMPVRIAYLPGVEVSEIRKELVKM